MRISFIHPILGAALLAGSQMSSAQNTSVKITSPADGSQLDATANNKVDYEVMPSPNGDLASLSPGRHDICIKVVNKGHTPIGVDQCVKVTVN